MSGRISRTLAIYGEGPAGEEIPEAVFIENKGMEGDRFADGGERQVTLLPAETVAWMAEQETPGLCFRRYKANVQTAGFDVAWLEAGDEIAAGEVIFRVSEVSKECFPGCVLAGAGRPCRLSGAGLFLKVARGGSICVGDEIKRL